MENGRKYAQKRLKAVQKAKGEMCIRDRDNADTRLTPIGREYGLVQDDRWAKYQHTQNILEAERRRDVYKRQATPCSATAPAV